MLHINNCTGCNMSFFTFSKHNISAGKTKHPKKIISHFKYKSDSFLVIVPSLTMTLPPLVSKMLPEMEEAIIPIKENQSS